MICENNDCRNYHGIGDCGTMKAYPTIKSIHDVM